MICGVARGKAKTMNKMKRLIPLFLALALIMIPACGPGQGNEPGDTTADISTETPDPSESTGPDTGNDDPEAPKIEHVVLVGADGAGAFFKEANTPNLDRIMEKGSVTYECVTAKPSISAQCWGSMLHGVVPVYHGLTNTLIEDTEYPSDSPFPSVFRVILENRPGAKVASFCDWNAINVGIIENGLDMLKETSSDDAELADKVCDYLKDNTPDFLFVQFSETDNTGHSHGYGSEQHIAQVEATDGYIGRIYDALEKNGMAGTTLFMVSADHGGTPEGTHGGWTDAEKYIMFAAAGPEVEPGETGEMDIRDMASIVLYALGLADCQPDTWTSRVPSGLFKGVEAAERPVYSPEYSYEYRMHDPEPTPDLEDSAASVIGTERVRAYFTFDGSIDDALGKTGTERGGKLYFVDGYYDQSVRLEDGYITLPDQKFGTDSFSFAFWVKTEGTAAKPPVISNKDWSDATNPGFVLCLKGSNDTSASNMIVLNVGSGSGFQVELARNLPEDFPNGWVYVVAVVDREAKKVRISLDFGEFAEKTIPGLFNSLSFDSLDLNLGQDGTGEYGSSLTAELDEFIIVDGVLTDEDVAALKEAYTAEK